MSGGRATTLSPAARRVLVSTLAANALLFFDQTAVTVALPAIQDDFNSPRFSWRS